MKGGLLLEYVEEWHGTMREPVYEHGLQLTLGEVEQNGAVDIPSRVHVYLNHCNGTSTNVPLTFATHCVALDHRRRDWANGRRGDG